MIESETTLEKATNVDDVSKDAENVVSIWVKAVQPEMPRRLLNSSRWLAATKEVDSMPCGGAHIYPIIDNMRDQIELLNGAILQQDDPKKRKFAEILKMEMLRVAQSGMPAVDLETHRNIAERAAVCFIAAATVIGWDLANPVGALEAMVKIGEE